MVQRSEPASGGGAGAPPGRAAASPAASPGKRPRQHSPGQPAAAATAAAAAGPQEATAHKRRRKEREHSPQLPTPQGAPQGAAAALGLQARTARQTLESLEVGFVSGSWSGFVGVKLGELWGSKGWGQWAWQSMQGWLERLTLENA